LSENAARAGSQNRHYKKLLTKTNSNHTVKHQNRIHDYSVTVFTCKTMVLSASLELLQQATKFLSPPSNIDSLAHFTPLSKLINVSSFSQKLNQ